jgi:nitrogen fixation/metabolism regulation signal transduction histidine kinase
MTTTLFDIAAEKLEESTDMDRLAARGTLRLALKEAGLDAQSLSVAQLRAVFEKLMPKELEARGVSGATAVCNAVMRDVASAANAADLALPESPDEIFKRLGGS